MNAQATDPRSAAEIEREVQQSRADIEHTLDAIQERLSPGQLVDQTLGYFRGGRGADFARNLGDSIAQNPMPVALMGVGLAWMMFGQRSARDDDRARSAYWDEDLDPVEEHYAGFAEEDMAYLGPEADLGFGEDVQEPDSTAKDRMGEIGDKARHVGDKVGEQARHAGEQARHAAAQARERVGRARAGMAQRAQGAGARMRYGGRRAKEGMLRSLDEHPLVLGAIGLAIGAALGAALPPSETEDELMGEARDKALRRATRAGREQAEKVRETAGAVAAAAREEAGRQGATPTSSGETGGVPPGQSAASRTDESRPAGSVGATPFPADPKARLDRP
jgi:ElaB/YqjD/DUF883 family membrane-anchored ribosome-binding protein